MKKVYIAGPMLGIPYFNFPAFDRAASLIRCVPAEPVSPADLDRLSGFDAMQLPMSTDWSEIPENFDFDACQARGVAAVMEADGICLLDGWENSKGALAEAALARWRGLAVFGASESALSAWENIFGEVPPIDWRTPFHGGASVDTAVDTAVDELIDQIVEDVREPRRCKCTEGAPVDVCDKGLDDCANAPAEPSVGAVEDTNPKDAVGSRKAKLSVIPGNVLFDLGLAMTEGAVKYGRHNYRICGVRASVYYDAAMGHLVDWWEGQDIDPDSGLNHVTKSIASLVILRDAMMQGMLDDDRPPSARRHKCDFNAMTCSIMDRHADKNPKHYTIGDTPLDNAR